MGLGDATRSIEI
jgi:hypothetical protein